MLYLHKLLPIFVLPLGWVALLLGVALFRRKRWPALAALVLLYVASMPVVGGSLLRGLESRYPPVPLDQVEKTDAVVCLSGFFGPWVPDGYLPNINEAGERFEAGVELLQRKKGDFLVFTGGRLPWARQAETDGARSVRLATARAIPADKMLVTREVGNTMDEALAARDLMRERGWRKITLVTSAAHMPRAARLFRKAGVDFVPFPVDLQVGANATYGFLSFLPQAEGLRNTEIALREMYGIAFYAALKR